MQGQSRKGLDLLRALGLRVLGEGLVLTVYHKECEQSVNLNFLGESRMDVSPTKFT